MVVNVQMSASAVARQTEQISETDLSSELQAARTQIRRLAKTQQETEDRVRHSLALNFILCLWLTVATRNDGLIIQELEWRRKFEKLVRDYEKLSGTMGETVLATEWRERCVVRE